MKKKIYVISAFVIVLITALILNQNIFSNISMPYPTFQVTVYQTASTTPQAYAEVQIENSNGTLIKNSLTNSSGIVSWAWDQPNGDYTIKVWFTARLNDGHYAQKTFTYSGSNFYTTITLGPVY